MEHFDINQWADFSRGVVSESARAAMDAHLSSQGCPECHQTVSLLRRVAAAVRAEAGYAPPEDAVRWVKALGVARRPQRARVPGFIGRLVYDSFRDPLPAGMRSEDLGSRQVVYEAGSLSIDLRLERDRATPAAILVGQITDRDAPGRPIDAPVLLMSRRDVVAHAVTNRFGEFQVEYTPAAHLKLLVPIGLDGRRVEVPLGQLADEPSLPKAQRLVTLRRLKAKGPGRRRS
jgi:hypothetical protein